MNKKIISILFICLLCVPVFLSPTVSVQAEVNEEKEKDFYIEETDEGFILRYEFIEEGQLVYYEEEQENNITYTKKYIKDNDESLLIEELETILDYKEDGSVIATIDNISDDTSSTHIVLEGENFSNLNQESLQLTPSPLQLDVGTLEFNPGGGSAQRKHPFHIDYVWRHTTRGHLGISRLTTAAATAALTSIIGGSNKAKVVLGSIGAVVAVVINGGWSNLYYVREHYIPYGSGPNRPLWKRIVKYYSNSSQSTKIGPTIYVDSTDRTTY